MKITSLSAWHVKQSKVLEKADGTQECLLVKIECNNELYGWGEAVTCAHVARAVVEAPRAAPFRHGLAAIVEGLDPLDIAAVNQEMLAGTSWYGYGGVVTSTIGAVDMALWDILAKHENKPLRSVLNDRSTDRIPGYASLLWPDAIADLEGIVSKIRENGFQAVKLGWGPMGKNLDNDRAMVVAAREALGRSPRLMVDAGRVWDLEAACQRVDAFSEFNIHWLEEPLAPHDFCGYRKLSKHANIPLACGEFFTQIHEFERLLDSTGVAVIQPDLGRVGGISGGLAIHQLCLNAQRNLVPHCFGSGVLRAATSQFIAALCPESPMEYALTESPFNAPLIRSDFNYQSGHFVLGDVPGLGVEVDEAALSAWRVK